MVAIDRSLVGESVQNTHRLTTDRKEILEDLRQRLYAADTILKFAAKSPILPKQTRDRFLQLTGRLMVELDVLGGRTPAEHDNVGFGSCSDDDDGLGD